MNKQVEDMVTAAIAQSIHTKTETVLPWNEDVYYELLFRCSDHCTGNRFWGKARHDRWTVSMGEKPLVSERMACELSSL